MAHRFLDEAVRQIINSVQDVVVNTKKSDFKRKCLGIVKAENFEEFRGNSENRLRRLLNERHSGLIKREWEASSRRLNKPKSTDTGPSSIPDMQASIIDEPSRSNIGKRPADQRFPIRKRARKAPLLEISKDLENECDVRVPLKTDSTCSSYDARMHATHARCNTKASADRGEGLSLPDEYEDFTSLCDFLHGKENELSFLLSQDHLNDELSSDICSNNIAGTSPPSTGSRFKSLDGRRNLSLESLADTQQATSHLGKMGESHSGTSSRYEEKTELDFSASDNRTLNSDCVPWTERSMYLEEGNRLTSKEYLNASLPGTTSFSNKQKLMRCSKLSKAHPDLMSSDSIHSQENLLPYYEEDEFWEQACVNDVNNTTLEKGYIDSSEYMT